MNKYDESFQRKQFTGLLNRTDSDLFDNISDESTGESLRRKKKYFRYERFIRALFLCIYTMGYVQSGVEGECRRYSQPGNNL